MSERYPVQTVLEAGETVPPRASQRGAPGLDPSSYRAILRLALPLVLSMAGLNLMHIWDRALLGRYSEEAVAAVGPAGMASYLLMSIFLGMAGYVSTFVAQYVGAGRPERAGQAVWQGLYVALSAGLGVAGCAFAAEPLFAWVGHAPEVRVLEVQFFQITCWGAPLAILGSALSGFFSGRGDTRTLMLVQLAGFALNAVLAYALIFGAFGLPEWGAAGAATASVCAQGFNTLVLAALFLRRRYRQEYGTLHARLDAPLLARLLKFGFPNGMRFFVELLAWTMFLNYVGRIGQAELAVTNICWTINGMAFFPVIGLSSAVSTLVGQAQGLRRPDLSWRCTWKGLLLAEVWMVTMGAAFLLAPGSLLRLFQGSESHLPALVPLGTVLLRYVALYCLLDGVNIVVVGTLQGAGDTRWTLGVSFLLHLVFLLSLATLDAVYPDLHAEWIAATVFVMLQAFVWLARFRSGQWRAMQVIEPGDGGTARMKDEG